jgi:uncharacterized protein affecting Mg2+/Co2+ transport
MLVYRSRFTFLTKHVCSLQTLLLDFLRAAKLWAKIELWLDDPHLDEIRQRIKGTLRKGRSFDQWKLGDMLSRIPSQFRQLPGDIEDLDTLEAIQAIYAFYGGQEQVHGMGRDLDLGLLGGWYANNAFCSTTLTLPSRFGDDMVCFGSVTYRGDGICKTSVYIGAFTGQVMLRVLGGDSIALCCTGLDSALSWMEEHAARLDEGRIGMNRDSFPAIWLYPRLPPNSPPTRGIQLASRAVTRGVEVVGSAFYSPLMKAMGVGFACSIRIRLLTPQDGAEYVFPEDRGFDTCQLRSRHWQIVDDETGETNRDDNDGVIDGLHPLLFEGGCRLNGRDLGSDAFIYQCSTYPMKKSRMQGHFTFAAGSDEYASADNFDVMVAPFLLDSEPEFLYC